MWQCFTPNPLQSRRLGKLGLKNILQLPMWCLSFFVQWSRSYNIEDHYLHHLLLFHRYPPTFHSLCFSKTRGRIFICLSTYRTSLENPVGHTPAAFFKHSGIWAASLPRMCCLENMRAAAAVKVAKNTACVKEAVKNAKQVLGLHVLHPTAKNVSIVVGHQW